MKLVLVFLQSMKIPIKIFFNIHNYQTAGIYAFITIFNVQKCLYLINVIIISYNSYCVKQFSI